MRVAIRCSSGQKVATNTRKAYVYWWALQGSNVIRSVHSNSENQVNQGFWAFSLTRKSLNKAKHKHEVATKMATKKTLGEILGGPFYLFEKSSK